MTSLELSNWTFVAFTAAVAAIAWVGVVWCGVTVFRELRKAGGRADDA